MKTSGCSKQEPPRAAKIGILFERKLGLDLSFSGKQLGFFMSETRLSKKDPILE